MAWLLVMAIVLSPGSAYAVGGAGVSENDIRAEEENWPDGPEIVGQSAIPSGSQFRNGAVYEERE